MRHYLANGYIIGFVLLVSLLVVKPAALGTTWNVPGDFATISNAVNSATDGDTILLNTNLWTECGIVVTKSLTIQGQGMTDTILQGAASRSNASSRIFQLNNAAKTLNIQNMTLQYGYIAAGTGYGGGAILNSAGTVTVQNCVFTMNDAFAKGGYFVGGGAIAQPQASDPSYTALSLFNCVFVNNSASGTNTTGAVGGGGAIWAGCSVTIDSCSFISNSANAYGAATVASGGAIQTSSLRDLTMRNSTFFGNSCSNNASSSGRGGAINLPNGTEVINLYNCTFASNVAGYAYSGAVSYGGSTGSGYLNIYSTIIAGNAPYEIYAVAPVSSNILSSCLIQGLASGITKNNCLTASNPLLQPLAYNGGLTPTLALATNSPAINHGSNPLGLSWDQRGAGFPRVRGATADIGAYEFGTGLLSYNKSLFVEKMPDNNGAIDNSSPLVITIRGDTFTGVDGSQLTNNVLVSNLPSGLTASIVRSNSGAMAVVTLLGNATQHVAFNSITNLGITFQDAAFNLGSAALENNASISNLVIQFYDIPFGALTYSSTNFNEDANWNDGRINNSLPVQVVLTGNDTFTGTNGEDFVAAGLVAVSNVPAGLTAVVRRASGMSAQVSLTGKASANDGMNSITNLGLAFQDTAFLGGSALSITNSTVNNLCVSFVDPTLSAALNYSGMIFYGAHAFLTNDGGFVPNLSGVIVTTNTIALSGGVLAGTNGQDFVGAGWVVVTNVPSGLAAVIIRVDDTHLAAAFSGTALADASTNNVTNLTFAFQASAFVNIPVAMVTNATQSNLSIFFAGPVAYNTFVNAVQSTPVSMAFNGTDVEIASIYLSVQIVNPPANGSALSTPSFFYKNSGQYTPNPGFVGTDMFTFQLGYLGLWSRIATCTVTVVSNTVPIAFDQSIQVDPGRTSAVFQVSYTDPDVSCGQTQRVMLISTTTSGTLLTNSFQTNGSFKYVPNNSFSGTDSFTWQVTDGMATSTVATCTLNVTPTQPPGPAQVLVLYNASYSGDENTNGVQDSLEVAQYYMAQRGIPTNNLLGMNCSTTTFYTNASSFLSEIVRPVQNKLVALGQTNIAILVFSYMTPWGINPSGMPYVGSLDTAMMIPNHWNQTTWNFFSWMSIDNPIVQPNPGFVPDPSHFIPSQISQPSLGTNMYLVGRLDGPGGVLRVKDYVDEALYAERYAYPTNGAFAGPGGGPASGNIYVDSEGRAVTGGYTDAWLATNSSVVNGVYSGYNDVDVNIAWAEHYVGPSGMQLKWEDTEPVIGSATNLIFKNDGTSAASAPRAFMYGGWYSPNTYNDVWGWLPGSIASDLDSYSLLYPTFRQTGRYCLAFGTQALQHGASCVAGVLNEPYTIGNPMPNVLIYFMLKGYSWGEASAYADPYLGWEGFQIGDPLYTPLRPGKSLVYDTQVPSLASGYPFVSSMGAAGVAVTIMVNSTTNLPMVVNAVVQWGKDTNYTNPPITLEGFYRQQRILFPMVDSGTTYHYRLILTSPVGISSTNGDYTFVSPTETPFATNNVPGVVRMQYFDNGGEGVAYHGCYLDNTFYAAGNSNFRGDTGFYWNSTTTNTLGNYPTLGAAVILYAAPSNTWLRYTVNIAANSLYTLKLPYGNFAGTGNAVKGGIVHIEQDGVNVTGPIVLGTNVALAVDSWAMATVSNVYLSAGQHILRLVYDTDGASFNYMEFIQQTNAPVASFTMTPLAGVGVVPLAIQVSATNSYDLSGTIVSYAWTFGDAGTATGLTASHFYASTGTYNVGLSVTDNNGLMGTTATVMRVTDGAGLDPAWCLFYFGTTNVDPSADLNGNGLSVLQDFRAGLDPTNPLSCFRVDAMTFPASSTGMMIRWDSVAGKLYSVDRSTNLLAVPPFMCLVSNIMGQANTTTYNDTNTVGSGSCFYRIGVP
ncbi:MAG: choice-of-anchor Q domain-containing protein [bacterium]